MWIAGLVVALHPLVHLQTPGCRGHAVAPRAAVWAAAVGRRGLAGLIIGAVQRAEGRVVGDRSPPRHDL